MTTQRRLALLLFSAVLLLGTNAFAKRHKRKATTDDQTPATETTPEDAAAAPAASDEAAKSDKTSDKTDEAPAAAASEDSKPVPAAATPADAAEDDEDKPVAHAVVVVDEPSRAIAPPPEPAASGLARSGNADAPEGITWKASGWSVTMYGYAALDVMQDSTQSFGISSGNAIVARRGTIKGNEAQAQATARDSRFGLRLAAPVVGSVRASVNIETDFNAPPPIEYSEANSVTAAGLRMRHYYMKVETPVVDIIAGQYHDLFGWGGKGFYPSTLAFIGITGEIYHRQPQIRLSKILGGDAVELEIAGAALRPVQKAGGYPDVEAGIRLAFNRWTGARQQAYGQPSIGSLAFGVSAIGRHFEVAQFLEMPGGTVGANGYGIAANAFIPVIPAHNKKERGNALSLTGEYSRGTGIADMYNSDLTGGLLFPTLPNPQNRQDPTAAAPVYPANIDPGIVTFDSDNRLRTCDWEGFVVGLQYYLPILDGRVWLSGNHSQVKSDNIKDITPLPGWGGIYTISKYYDGSLFVAITDAIQMGASFQVVQQTLGDGVKAQNYRSEFGMHMFF
jgi:hypothetical protein